MNNEGKETMSTVDATDAGILAEAQAMYEHGSLHFDFSEDWGGMWAVWTPATDDYDGEIIGIGVTKEDAALEACAQLRQWLSA